MNEADSLRMESLLKASGYQTTQQLDNADVVVVNTCSVRHKPEHKVLSYVGRLKKLRQTRATTVAVVGCVAQQRGNDLIKASHGTIDIVLGPDALDTLPQAIDTVRQHNKRVVDTEWRADMGRAYNLPLVKDDGSATRTSAYINIMKGCDHFCTFCIVPYTRGRERSRPISDVVSELKHATENGLTEVTLLGQNIDSYGRKTGESLHELIHQLAPLPGLRRIRFLTSHPRDMQEELMDCYRDIPKLMPYLHIPVQSGSDRILKMMNRKYTSDIYRECIDKVRERQPDITISSDFIVGFPGETEEDFEQTIQLVHDIKFGMSYSFIYSPRPGTRAAGFEDSTETAAKSQRLYRLRELLDNQAESLNREGIGKSVPILIERSAQNLDVQDHADAHQANSPNNWSGTGRTPGNRLVRFTSPMSCPVGTEIYVTIDDARRSYLSGTHQPATP